MELVVRCHSNVYDLTTLWVCVLILAKTPYYIVHGFWPDSENFDFDKKRIPYERTSQEEQIDTNFSFIAPSTLE